MTDHQWRLHVSRLDQALDRIEARVERMTADLEGSMRELTARCDRVDARVDRLASTWLVVGAWVALARCSCCSIRSDGGPPMLTTRHPVDFPYTRPELEALLRYTHAHDVEQGGRYDARFIAWWQ